jgi:hypothetical protein
VNASPGLRDAAPSVHTLASEVLSAALKRDVTRLEALALREDEFHSLVWPRLPASRSEAGVPAAYAWGDLHTKSRASLHQTLEGLERAGLVLVSVRFTGPVSDHGLFRIYRGSVLEVRQADGTFRRIRLFGSVIEQDGRVKVFSYIVQ